MKLNCPSILEKEVPCEGTTKEKAQWILCAAEKIMNEKGATREDAVKTAYRILSESCGVGCGCTEENDA